MKPKQPKKEIWQQEEKAEDEETVSSGILRGDDGRAGEKFGSD